mgnify:CR=1 FL=1|jgi:hypothetical protein|tara:strand:+ start:132 stop:965 length:834 start_codon:yes stop_codon:yes gene_type:complete
MSFGENIKNSLKILVLNEQALIDISNNEKSTLYGFLTLIIAGFATAIASLSLFGLILYPIITIIGLFIGYSIYHFIAKFILGGQATGLQYFRALSNSFVIYWFTFVPFLGIVLSIFAGLWLIIVNIFILLKVHKLSKAKAIILGLLPVILFIILLMLVIIGGLAYFGVLSPTRFLPEDCRIHGGIDCTDFQTSSDGTTQFVVYNRFGKEDFKSLTVTLESECTPNSVDLRRGQKMKFSCMATEGEIGERYRHDILLSYTTTNGISKTIEGTLYTKYS